MEEVVFWVWNVGPLGLGLALLVYGPLRGVMGSRWVAPMCSLGVSLMLLSVVGWFTYFGGREPTRWSLAVALFGVSLVITIGFYWIVWRSGRGPSAPADG